MGTISIDDDLRDAIKAERMTWQEAGGLQDLRRERARLDKQMQRLQEKLDPLDKAFNATDERYEVLSAKVNGAE